MAEKLLMLALSPTMDRGVIARWRKAEGDPVAPGDLMCDVETDKTTMEYENVDLAGVLLRILVPAGGEARVGEPIAWIGQAGEAVPDGPAGAPPSPTPGPEPAPSAPGPAPTLPSPAAPPATGRRVKASPLARRMARERGLDLAAIAATGPGGRVVRRDIEAAAPALPIPHPAPSPATPQPATGEAVREPIGQKRRVIAQRLTESKNSAPHYYLKTRVIIDGLLAARERINRDLAGRVGLNAFLIRLTAAALGRHPWLNAAWQEDAIIRHPRADIGVAVALPDGLITPVIRDAAAKGVQAIDTELRDLIARARENRLSLAEFTGATFTISNLGGFGVEEFTAIINPPNAAILAVGEARREPVVEADDTIRVRTVVRLTLSCDHRLVDGAVGAAFLQDLRQTIEEPLRALL